MATSSIFTEDGRTVLPIVGPLDSYSAPRVRSSLRKVERDCDLVVDLSECTYVDTAGLWILRARALEAEQAGGSMVIRCLAPKVRRLFEGTGFDKLVVIEDEPPSSETYRAGTQAEPRIPYRETVMPGEELG